jgi:L-ascorbate metabolism protein UlaG (beta-lactamase superfamily)
MKIKWLGHAAFLITTDSGTRIITDPYETSDALKYGEIVESADIVTISHEHGDHSNVAAVQGSPQVIRETTRAKGIDFRGISTYHDENAGSKRGKNTIFCFEVDGVNVCHLGDLGHLLSDKQAAEMGKIDVLLIPVGGFYTIDAKAASQLCDQLKPGGVIPMHYKNDKCTFPIASVDEFLRGKKNVAKMDASEVELKAGELPASTQIMVLQPAK